jgi:hypothetical protein
VQALAVRVRGAGQWPGVRAGGSAADPGSSWASESGRCSGLSECVQLSAPTVVGLTAIFCFVSMSRSSLVFEPSWGCAPPPHKDACSDGGEAPVYRLFPEWGVRRDGGGDSGRGVRGDLNATLKRGQC